MSDDMMIYVLGGLAFLVVAGLGLAFSGGGGSENAAKRAKQIANNERAVTKSRRTGPDPEVVRRTKQNKEMLAQLRKQGQQQKKSILPTDVSSIIAQAGLDMSVSTFWMISGVVGVLAMALAFVTGAGANGATLQGVFIPGPLILIGAGFAGTLGLPRWFLGIIAKRRNKKLTGQFADAIDIIVRGVKSGLPLTECLRIIARESPAPLGTEFQTLTDNIAMGTTFERALQRFYQRVPLSEVNFFVIVLTIQSKSGGNLSEALGNLSAVIRSRKMMREKIKAMSSEAKASAGIIAALPPGVALMVYFSTPSYIAELWLKEAGHFILFCAAGLMFVGVMVMRRMINFEV